MHADNIIVMDGGKVAECGTNAELIARNRHALLLPARERYAALAHDRFVSVGKPVDVAGKPVLENVSFTVPQGSTLGIIGGTGSGKSTLGCLIDGLYAPTAGKITIGGRDVTQIPPATLRKNVGFVLPPSKTISPEIAPSYSP